MTTLLLTPTLARGGYGPDPIMVFVGFVVIAAIYQLLVQLGASKVRGSKKPQTPRQQRRHEQKSAQEGLNSLGGCIGGVCVIGVIGTILWQVIKLVWNLLTAGP